MNVVVCSFDVARNYSLLGPFKMNNIHNGKVREAAKSAFCVCAKKVPFPAAFFSPLFFGTRLAHTPRELHVDKFT